MYKVKDATSALAKNDFERAVEIYKYLKIKYATSAFDLTIDYLKKKIVDNFSLNSEKPKKFPVGISSIFEALGVEAIYVVSMRSQIERRMRVIRELDHLGLSHLLRFIDGIEGYCDPEAQLLYQNYLQRSCDTCLSSKHIPLSAQKIMKKNATVGTFGYLLSQKKLFEDALRSGLQRICVFDDDAFFSDQFDLEACTLAINNQLPNDFLIFHLGASEYSEEYPVNNVSPVSPKLYCAIPHKTCGSFATVYTREAFQLILDGISEFDGPFDNVALGSVYFRYPTRCHVIAPNICAADVQTSSIRNSRDQFIHSEKMRWLCTSERYEQFTKPISINIIVRNISSLSEDLIGKRDNKFFQIRFFYCGQESIRPLHSARSASYSFNANDSQRAFDSIYSACSNELPNILPRLPDADFCVLWPSNINLTKTELVNAYFSHLGFPASTTSTTSSFKTFTQKFDSKTVKGRVSVIMPVARSFDLVKPSIVSVIQQDYNDVELIIVIDSPAKIDLEFIKDFIGGEIGRGNRKSFTFKIIQHSQVRYGCGARNTGLFNSSGEYVCFLDDDDLYLPGRVAKAINYLTSPGGSEFEACYCGYNGLWASNEGEDLSRYKEGNLLFDLLALQYKSHFVHTGTVTYRARSLFMLQGFDEKYKRHQDIELNARYFRYWKIGCVKNVGMVFKPNRSKVKPTVIIDFLLMLCIKRYLLEDFRVEISRFSKDELDVFLNAHAADLKALSPHGENLGQDSATSILRLFLG